MCFIRQWSGHVTSVICWADAKPSVYQSPFNSFNLALPVFCCHRPGTDFSKESQRYLLSRKDAHTQYYDLGLHNHQRSVWFLLLSKYLSPIDFHSHWISLLGITFSPHVLVALIQITPTLLFPAYIFNHVGSHNTVCLLMFQNLPV